MRKEIFIVLLSIIVLAQAYNSMKIAKERLRESEMCKVIIEECNLLK